MYLHNFSPFSLCASLEQSVKGRREHRQGMTLFNHSLVCVLYRKRVVTKELISMRVAIPQQLKYFEENFWEIL